MSQLLSSAQCVGFSGSRSVVPVPQVSQAVAAVPAATPAVVGCAPGVDALVRSLCPKAQVFRASDTRLQGRAAYAVRSQQCVEAVPVVGGVWVSFPSGACPVGLVPSSAAGRCFSGWGSGSWASLAYAAGRGVACLLWLPSSFSPPAWGWVGGAGGWYLLPATKSIQLSLF